MYGNGVRTNYKKAFEYLSKAAEKGDDMEDITQLGVLYEKGKGVKRNYQTALKLYQKAAEQQNAWAYLRIGYCYEDGKGVTQSPSRAFDYFMQAAKLGNASAMFNVGFYWLRINNKQALKWYTKSFNKTGRLDIATVIGALYEKGGPGLKPNLEEAAKWYEIAKDEERLERVRNRIGADTGK